MTLTYKSSLSQADAPCLLNPKRIEDLPPCNTRTHLYCTRIVLQSGNLIDLQ